MSDGDCMGITFLTFYAVSAIERLWTNAPSRDGASINFDGGKTCALRMIGAHRLHKDKCRLTYEYVHPLGVGVRRC